MTPSLPPANNIGPHFVRLDTAPRQYNCVGRGSEHFFIGEGVLLQSRFDQGLLRADGRNHIGNPGELAGNDNRFRPPLDKDRWAR